MYLYSDDEITEILASVQRIPCFEEDKNNAVFNYKSVIYRGGRGNIVSPRRLHSWSEVIGFWQASSPQFFFRRQSDRSLIVRHIIDSRLQSNRSAGVLG